MYVWVCLIAVITIYLSSTHVVFSLRSFCAFTKTGKISKSKYFYNKWSLNSLPNSKPQTFDSQEEYLNYLNGISSLPAGFSVGTTRFDFRPFEVDKILQMNLTLVVLDKPTSSIAAAFTSNQFPGGPIIVGKDRLRSSPTLQAIVINNKISNVCPGGLSDRGVSDSENVCEIVATGLGLESKSMVFPSSTGIIGWRLPISAIEQGMPDAIKNLQSKSALPAALGIMTTDRYPKLRSSRSADNRWSVLGFAKGAGMIEPNMATMLGYILTDLNIPRNTLQELLNKVIKKSFNAISVDGDQSTSDTVLVLSSQKVQPTAADMIEFEQLLSSICLDLAADIVQNGEGTQHVIRISVSGAPNDLFARDLGRFVVNSNLVKCAVAGSDPNVGRIVGAIGSFLSKSEALTAAGVDSNVLQNIVESLSITIGDVEIFSNGAFQLDSKKEKLLSDYMLDAQLYPSEVAEHDRNYPRHSKVVEIGVNLGSKGTGSCVVIGSDLTKEYVDVNADYRS